MATKKAKAGKKYYTPLEANAALPLVRAIVQDIMKLAHELKERDDRLRRVLPGEHEVIDRAHREEIDQLQADLERDQEQMNEYFQELAKLSVELKDPFTGLLDFRCWLNGREVYLCWRHGEPAVTHWHDLDAGFAGRQEIRKTDVCGEQIGMPREV